MSSAGTVYQDVLALKAQSMHNSIKTFTISILHTNQSYELHMSGENTVGDLQSVLNELIGGPARIMGLPAQINNGLQLNQLKLKSPMPLLVMPAPVAGQSLRDAPWLRKTGHVHKRTLSALFEHVDPSHHHVLAGRDEDAIDLSDKNAINMRISCRGSKYLGYMFLAPLDPSKLFLVLDVDQTILSTDVYNKSCIETVAREFPHKITGPYVLESFIRPSTPREYWTRPYLHEFLTAVAPFYNIIIWSATGSAHVQDKLIAMGVLNERPSDPPLPFDISLIIDYGAMVRFSVRTPDNRVREFNSKPLEVLAALFPQISLQNTYIVDDHRRSFILNPQCGIKVEPFKANAAGMVNRADDELLRLSRFLLMLPEKSAEQRARVDVTRWKESAALGELIELPTSQLQLQGPGAAQVHASPNSLFPSPFNANPNVAQPGESKEIPSQLTTQAPSLTTTTASLKDKEAFKSSETGVDAMTQAAGGIDTQAYASTGLRSNPNFQGFEPRSSVSTSTSRRRRLAGTVNPPVVEPSHEGTTQRHGRTTSSLVVEDNSDEVNNEMTQEALFMKGNEGQNGPSGKNKGVTVHISHPLAANDGIIDLDPSIIDAIEHLSPHVNGSDEDAIVSVQQ